MSNRTEIGTGELGLGLQGAYPEFIVNEPIFAVRPPERMPHIILYPAHRLNILGHTQQVLPDLQWHGKATT